MDIDLTTIIIVVIAFLFFAIPIVIDQNKKKKSKKIEKQLQDLAAANNLILKQMEAWGENYGIGIDKKARKLIYINMRENESEQIIDLHDVLECRSTASYKTVKKSEDHREVNDSVFLILAFKKPGISNKKLEFFKSTGNRFLQNEHDLANKWAAIVKDSLKSV